MKSTLCLGLLLVLRAAADCLISIGDEQEEGLTLLFLVQRQVQVPSEVSKQILPIFTGEQFLDVWGEIELV